MVEEDIPERLWLNGLTRVELGLDDIPFTPIFYCLGGTYNGGTAFQMVHPTRGDPYVSLMKDGICCDKSSVYRFTNHRIPSNQTQQGHSKKPTQTNRTRPHP